MSIPLIVLGNGRHDCLTQTITSIRDHLTGHGPAAIVDDSGDTDYHDQLAGEFPDFTVMGIGGEPVGYWRAMRFVWRTARNTGAPHVLMWEEDFTLTHDVDAGELAAALDDLPYLTQMALLRQPWFHNEHEHGGLIEALEAQGQTFTEQTDGDHHWVEHRACFTGNPSVIPRRTFEQDWPEGAWSESRFGRVLFADRRARGAFWGRRDDKPRVQHIGHERTGHDY